ncbi:MAG TPA: DUF2130 domain-containing protein [Ignavibacteria bacterium]|nr:DUF2130 domain-containing protein [Ignavibacteria bacterium]
MKSIINCPGCGVEINVEEVMAKEIENKLSADYKKKSAQQTAILMKEKEKLEKEKNEFEQKRARENELFKERLEKTLKEENEKNKIRLEEEKKRIEKLAREESELKIKQLEEENEKRKKENLKLKQKELDLLKAESELKEKQEQLKLETEKQMLEQKEKIVTEVRQKEEEKHLLKMKEYEKQLEDQKKLIDEMKRKSEQGSMQMQGEVLELALEDLLKSEFPFDKIEEVAKGSKGADVIQTVINNLQNECGIIIYESKRTKSFSEGWIDKLKEDMRNVKATVAILVTETLPKDQTKPAYRNGVWVCSFSDVKFLATLFRESILREYSIKSIQENKSGLKDMMYDYITSTEFTHKIDAIVEGFTAMKSDIEKEKNAMNKLWKEREKNIERIVSNTIDMYGSIKGIGGQAIPTVKSLELGTGEE